MAHAETANGNKKLKAAHVADARRGHQLTCLMKDYKKELDEINARLKKDFTPGDVLVLPGEVRVPIFESVSNSIGDADGLKEKLGTRQFNKLVKRSETFKPTDDLLALEDALPFLKKRISVSVKYLPLDTEE